MLLAALRDMQWRKRRFVIAVLSTAIIFAMTLVLTGLANGFRAEAQTNRRFARRRRVSGQGRCVRPVRRGDAVRADRPPPDRRVPRRAGGGPAGVRRRHGHARRRDTQRRPVRRAGTRPGHARSVGGPSTREPQRGRGLEHARTQRGRGHPDRFAQAAHRRHRGELHGTGQPAQHLPHHRGCPTAGVRRTTVGRVDRDSGHARPGAAGLQGHRPRRCGRRSAPAAEGGGQLHHDRGDSALGRRGPDRRDR